MPPDRTGDDAEAICVVVQRILAFLGSKRSSKPPGNDLG
jgi:hypothetical protein